MRLKKTFSAVLSGVMAVCFTVSGVNFAPATQLLADDTSAVVSGEAVAATKEAVVVNGYKNPVYNAETDTAEWDYVYFGTYPKSEVKGDDLTDAIIDAEYDVDDIAVVDGVKYKRVSPNSATFNYKFGRDKNVPATEGEFFEWGSKNEYHYFKFEPLKWRVLESSEEGKLFLMADMAIDCVNYMPREHKVGWYNTEMRSWLNEYSAAYNEPKEDFSAGGFLSMTFTEEEKAAIIGTDVETNENKLWGSTVDGMIGAQSTNVDKIFILSAEDALNENYGFCPDESVPSKTRQMKMTDYAFAKGGWAGAADELQGNCWWILRSPGDHERKMTLGYRDGRVYMEGYYASLMPYACMVPVCYVDVNSTAIVKADDVEQLPGETPDVTGPAVTVPTTPAVEVVYGDVDMNKKVDLSDAQAVLKAALKITTLTDEQTTAADVDGSGIVDLTDAQLILKYALRITSEFPVESMPGTEPTVEPTVVPTTEPTVEPTEEATPEPSVEPLVQPTDNASGHIWIAGDSIAAVHEYNDANNRATIGWGVIIGKYFSEDVVIHNTALSSRSSKSYIQEDEYDEIMNGMNAGDYLIISFGHNDEFPELARHTNPYGASTDEGSYKWYLKNYYIDPAIRKGAIPVLVSSVVERNFIKNDFYYQFHSVYKTAMEELVAEYKELGITIPYIDLHSQMQELYLELGSNKTKLLHAEYQSQDSDDNYIQVIDNTHFTLAGARYATKYILEGFTANGLDIMKYANADMIATLDSIATPGTFKIGDLDEWITKGAEDNTQDPIVPDVSGGAVTPEVSGGAVTPEVSGGAVQTN